MADYRFVSRPDLLVSKSYAYNLIIFSMLLKKMDHEELRARVGKITLETLKKYQKMILDNTEKKITNLQAYYKKSCGNLKLEDYVKIYVYYNENCN